MEDFKIDSDNQPSAILDLLVDVLVRIRNIEQFIYAKETKGDSEKESAYIKASEKTLKVIYNEVVADLYSKYSSIEIDPNKTEE